jgi:hypothetical protein
MLQRPLVVAVPEGYNTKRPHQGRGMNGRTPIRAFTEGMPKTSNTEVTSQTKTAKLKAARGLLQMRLLSGDSRRCTRWSALSAQLLYEIHPSCLYSWLIPFAAQHVIRGAAQNRDRSKHHAYCGQAFALESFVVSCSFRIGSVPTTLTLNNFLMAIAVRNSCWGSGRKRSWEKA